MYCLTLRLCASSSYCRACTSTRYMCRNTISNLATLSQTVLGLATLLKAAVTTKNAFPVELVNMQICSYHLGSNRMVALARLLESLHGDVLAHLAFVQGSIQRAQKLHAALLFEELHCQGQHCIILCRQVQPILSVQYTVRPQ